MEVEQEDFDSALLK